MLDLSAAVVLYCTLVAGVFLGLWLYYDHRDHARFELERRQTTFHCIKCDALYTAPAGTDLAPCPRCAHPNSRLRF
ncbi:MAG: hydrogenase nickel incorporation protein HypA [Verrucomicrobia bacterium]|nr:hydrogenase nickel incorporation protein HypA [Verrucomicrobiota bacterium]